MMPCNTCKYRHKDLLEGNLCVHGGFDFRLKSGTILHGWPDAPLEVALEKCKELWYVYKRPWWRIL